MCIPDTINELWSKGDLSHINPCRLHPRRIAYRDLTVRVLGEESETAKDQAGCLEQEETEHE